jgi:phage N-6-adenine-methyltransferase
VNDEWETPEALFEAWNDTFEFELDAAASTDNYKVPLYFTEEDDALQMSWWDAQGSGATQVWLNPPYSRGKIEPFMKKAAEEYRLHPTMDIVCLVRMDPSAKWFQKYVDGVAPYVAMLDRRVKFKGAEAAYNFPCCVVIYRSVTCYIGVDDGMTQYYIEGW